MRCTASSTDSSAASLRLTAEHVCETMYEVTHSQSLQHVLHSGADIGSSRDMVSSPCVAVFLRILRFRASETRRLRLRPAIDTTVAALHAACAPWEQCD